MAVDRPVFDHCIALYTAQLAQRYITLLLSKLVNDVPFRNSLVHSVEKLTGGIVEVMLPGVGSVGFIMGFKGNIDLSSLKTLKLPPMEIGGEQIAWSKWCVDPDGDDSSFILKDTDLREVQPDNDPQSRAGSPIPVHIVSSRQYTYTAPQCKHTIKNGRQCRLHTRSSSGYCRHHEKYH